MWRGVDEMALVLAGLPTKAQACDYATSELLRKAPPIAPLERARATACAFVALYLKTSQNGSFLTEELTEWRVAFQRS